MRKFPIKVGLVAAILAMAFSPSYAELAAERLTPDKCEARGISVTVTHTTGAPLHKVTVKIAESQEWFKTQLDQGFVPRIVEGGSGTPVRFSIPVGVATDLRGNKEMTFSMTREMLTESRLWVRSNGYIELRAFLDPAEAR